MVCSNNVNDDGYATVSAVMISLVLSLIAVAGAARALQALKLARSDLHATQARYALEGMHNEVALKLLQDERVVRFHWQGVTTLGPADVLAEPEASKISLQDAARSIVSRYGQASSTLQGHEGEPVGDVAISRVGQVWRIRITAANGWRDDRLVRFTGSQKRPAATIQRQFLKVEGEDPCDIVLAAA